MILHVDKKKVDRMLFIDCMKIREFGIRKYCSNLTSSGQLVFV